MGTCDVQPGRRPTGKDLARFHRRVPAPLRGVRRPLGPDRDRRAGCGLGGLRRRDPQPDRRRLVIGKHSLFGPVDPAADAGYADAPARKGFFTDTSVCIGCKACEVACKEWNDVPADHFDMLGMSYDNSRCAERQPVAPRRVHRAAEADGGPADRAPSTTGPAAGTSPRRPRHARFGCARGDAAGDRHGRGADGLPVADDVGRLQALHPRRLPRRLPDRVAVPHGVRHGRRAGGHLQRLRLLRLGLPVRRDRPPQGRGVQERRHRPEVHALLRPARRRAETGLRPGLPDRVDPVR